MFPKEDLDTHSIFHKIFRFSRLQIPNIKRDKNALETLPLRLRWLYYGYIKFMCPNVFKTLPVMCQALWRIHSGGGEIPLIQNTAIPVV